MLQDGEGEGWRSAFLRSFQGSPCCWSKDCALSSEERVYKQPAGCSHSRVWIQKPNSPVALRRSAWQCRLLCWAVSPASSSAPARWPALGGFFLQSGFRSPVSAYKLFPHSKSVPNPSCAAESLVKLSFFFFLLVRNANSLGWEPGISIKQSSQVILLCSQCGESMC